MDLNCTIVFEKNYDAIHTKCFFVKKKDDKGTFEIYVENENDELEYKQDYKFNEADYKFEEYPNISYLTDVNEKAPEELQHLLYNRYRYILNRGSSRSSKTYSIIDCFDIYARKSKNKRLTVWRDTKTDCVKTVLSDMLKHHKQTSRFKVGYNFNSTKSIFYYNHDTTVEIHGTDDDETVHGLTQDLAWLNEPYKISKDTFDQIDQRTNEVIILDLNPKKSHWSDKLEKNPRTLIIHSTFKDNPFCPLESKRKLLSYQPVKYAQVVIDGKINANDALEYNTEANKLLFTKAELRELRRCQKNEHEGNADEYNWQVYGLGLKAEKPNKIYKGWKLINPIEFDKIPATSYFGLDFGETNPTALVECKYHDGWFYFKELVYRPGKEIESLAALCERFGIEKGTDIIVCDDASPDKIGDLRGAGFYAMGANKGRVVDGISFLNKMNVMYCSNSNNLDDEYDNYEWELDRYGLPTDKPIKKNDHLMDAIRYVAMFLKNYLNIVVELNL